VEEILGFAVPLLTGRGIFNYDFGLLPYRRPVVSVVGRPLRCPKTDGRPSDELVDEWHAKYLESLQSLYDEFKDVYYSNRKQDLIIK